MAQALAVLVGGVAALLVLSLRHGMKPAAIQVSSPTVRKDWSNASFGLDLVVGSLFAGPTAYAIRLSIVDRIEGLRASFPMMTHGTPVQTAAINGFFGHTNSDANSAMVGLILLAVICVSFYILFFKHRAYDVNVPIGCTHPALRMQGFVFESGIGVGMVVAVAISVVWITQ